MKIVYIFKNQKILVRTTVFLYFAYHFNAWLKGTLLGSRLLYIQCIATWGGLCTGTQMKKEILVILKYITGVF